MRINIQIETYNKQNRTEQNREKKKDIIEITLNDAPRNNAF